MIKLPRLKRKKRARNKKGRYVGDDPRTANVNEAYQPMMMSILEGYNDTMRRFLTLY
tara:strand:- start:285 stop:455 length:171 start_codon:yes stop_codon:yes gene_type:complete